MHQLFSGRDCDRTSATFRVPTYRSQEGVISHARGEHSSAPPVKRQRGPCASSLRPFVGPISCNISLGIYWDRFLELKLSRTLCYTRHVCPTNMPKQCTRAACVACVGRLKFCTAEMCVELMSPRRKGSVSTVTLPSCCTVVRLSCWDPHPRSYLRHTSDNQTRGRGVNWGKPPSVATTACVPATPC